jgi:preprotein translocase subunit SecF
MRKMSFAVGLLALLLQIPAAQAYIGPGAGAGTIAIVMGILSSIFLAFVGILWYPIKRLLKGKKAKTTNTATRAANDTGRSSGNTP